MRLRHRDLGGLAVRGSVTEPADLQRPVTTALDRFGRIGAVASSRRV